MKREKIILGIDPGSRTAGFAVIKQCGRKLSYIDSGIMQYSKENIFLQRLGIIYNSCCELIERYAPDEVSFESLIYVKSPTALIKLAQARGAMVAAFQGVKSVPVYEYSPNLVKSTVVGHGHADKAGIQKGLGLIFHGQSLSFKTHDESDALAIAVCHAMNSRARTCTSRAGGSSLKQLGEQILKERQNR